MNNNSKNRTEESLRKAFFALQSGNADEARKLFDSLCQTQTDDPELNAQLGRLCFDLGEYATAAKYYTKALSANPDNPRYLALVANAYISLKEYQQAETLLLKALSIEPNCNEAESALGGLYALTGKNDKAEELLEKALLRRPNDAGLHSYLALLFGNLGQYEKALQHAEALKRCSPKNRNPYYVLGKVLTEMGRFSDAVKQYEQAIKIDPGFGVAYEGLSKAKKFTSADLPLIEVAEARLKAGMPTQERYSLHFALGKMLDDMGQWDRAFEHFRQGNLLAKAAIKPQGGQALFKQQKRLCTRRRLVEAQRDGNPSEVPIFIVGMPRSGTSLIEQIISSHPQAAGAGELLDMSQAAIAICSSFKSGILPLRNSETPSREELDRYANAYLQALRKGREQALRVTDKLPGNYLSLGMIALLFPRARIIHVVRHPLDTCLSCYFQMMTEQLWTYDLDWIAEFYRFYRKAMDYWKKTLPSGKIIDVHYEKLIDDPEGQSRLLIERCGLEWDPRCLGFFDSGREVKTASVWQVRQPIYKSSKMRWTKYASHIGGLAHALGDYLQNDRDMLREHGIMLKKKLSLGGFG